MSARRAQILAMVSAFEQRRDAAGMLRTMGDRDRAYLPDLWEIVQLRAAAVAKRNQA